MIVTLEELKDRLDWDLDEQEERIATSALMDLEVEARDIGSITWTARPVTPEIVVRLILKAAMRYMANPNGYIVSRAGDEQLGWSERQSSGAVLGPARFMEEEAARLAQLAYRPRNAFGSFGTFAWGSLNERDTPTIPVDYAGKRFPDVFDPDLRRYQA